MKKLVCLLFVVMLAIPATSSAFDGARTGFVAGGGLGFAPYVKWSIQDTPFSTEKIGLGADLSLGYAWDDMNMIMWEGNVASYSENGISVAQGFTGPAWYHYFGPTGHTFFTEVGLGLYYLRVEGESADPGLGMILGAGYEFMPHVQAVVTMSGGRTNDPYIDGLKYNHTTISMSVQAFAF